MRNKKKNGVNLVVWSSLLPWQRGSIFGQFSTKLFFEKISKFSDFKGIDPLNNKSKWREKCILNFHYIMTYSCCKNNDVKSFYLHKICASMGKGLQILYFVRKIQTCIYLK